MTISFVYDGHTTDSASASTIVLTTTIAYPAGCRIIVYGNTAGVATTNSFADSRGNTYAVDKATGGGAIGSAQCTTALQIGDTITVTFSSTQTGHTALAGYIKGQVVPSALDKTAGANGSGAGAADSGNTATTTQANEILIGCAGVVGAAVTEDVNYTAIDNFIGVAGLVTQTIGKRTVSATGAYNYRPTFSGTHGFGSIVCTYKQQDPFTITPSVGTLTVTGQAPAVSIGQTTTPSAGAVALTGQAPVITSTDNHLVTPSAGSLTITGQAPVVTEADNRYAAPSAGSLSLTGQAPVVTATDNHPVTPGAGSIAITGQAPVVTQQINIAPAAGAITITGEQPAVTQQINITPDAGSIAIIGEQPVVTATDNHAIAPDAGSVAITGEQPIVTATTRAFISPGAGSIAITGEQPVVSVFIRLHPGPDNIVVPAQVTSLLAPRQVTAIVVPPQVTALLAPRQVTSITPEG